MVECQFSLFPQPGVEFISSSNNSILFDPIAHCLGPFHGGRSTDVSEEQHGSLVEVVVGSLVCLPCIYKFFGPALVSAECEW